MEQKLTGWEQADATAASITQRVGKEVKSFRFDDGNGGFIYGYFIAPDFPTKLNLWTKIDNGLGTQSASALLETNLVRPESDERISQTLEEGKYWMGACLTVLSTVQVALPELKKK